MLVNHILKFAISFVTTLNICFIKLVLESITKRGGCGGSVYVSFSGEDALRCSMTDCLFKNQVWPDLTVSNRWVGHVTGSCTGAPDGQSATGSNYNFIFPSVVFLSIVLLPQRAQVRCLAVAVDALTGEARLMMMRWEEMYTETCSSNQPLLLFQCSLFDFWIMHSTVFILFFELFFINHYSYRRRILGTEVTRRKRKTSSGSSGRYVNYLWQLNYLFVDKTLTSECRLSLL